MWKYSWLLRPWGGPLGPVLLVYGILVAFVCLSFRWWSVTRCTWLLQRLFRSAYPDASSVLGFHRSGFFAVFFSVSYFWYAQTTHILHGPIQPHIYTHHWYWHSHIILSPIFDLIKCVLLTFNPCVRISLVVAALEPVVTLAIKGILILLKCFKSPSSGSVL